MEGTGDGVDTQWEEGREWMENGWIKTKKKKNVYIYMYMEHEINEDVGGH